MEPKLKQFDLVAIQKYDMGKIRKGDYVAFAANGTLNGKPTTFTIVHSVVEVLEKDGKRALRTKGVSPNVGVDAMLVTETGETGTNVYLGKYVFKNTPLGHMMGFIKSGTGLVVLAINTLFLVAYVCLLKAYDQKPRAVDGVLPGIDGGAASSVGKNVASGKAVGSNKSARNGKPVTPGKTVGTGKPVMPEKPVAPPVVKPDKKRKEKEVVEIPPMPDISKLFKNVTEWRADASGKVIDGDKAVRGKSGVNDGEGL